jgi:hypothetical protein
MARRFRTLGQIQKYIRVKEEPFDGTSARGTNQQIQYNNNGLRAGVPNFTFDGTDLKITDDTKMKFGTNSDAHIEYNENGDNFLVISGSDEGIVLSGSTIQIAGTLEGASPLKIGGEMVFTSTGSAGAFAIGPNSEAKIYYENEADDHLIISGSAGGTRLLGTNISIPSGNLGVRINGDVNITHGITLPDTSAPEGQVKANAFVSYSSIRFKENVEPINSAVETISKLKGVSYNWIDTGKKDFGFIAEEVGKVLPEIVEWSQDPEYANTMDYTRIISFLVEAVKEQQKKIDIISEKLDKIKV